MSSGVSCAMNFRFHMCRVTTFKNFPIDSLGSLCMMGNHMDFSPRLVSFPNVAAAWFTLTCNKKRENDRKK